MALLKTTLDLLLLTVVAVCLDHLTDQRTQMAELAVMIGALALYKINRTEGWRHGG